MTMEVILKMSEKAMDRLNVSPKRVTSVEVEKNSCLMMVKDVSEEATSNIISTESNLKNKLKGHLPSSIENSKEEKSKNLPYDITRVILKPCENQIASNCEAPISDTPGKRKLEIFNEKELVNIATVKENKNYSGDMGSPPCKKQCLDDELVDGQANAFKLLMMAQNTKVKKKLINIVVRK